MWCGYSPNKNKGEGGETVTRAGINFSSSPAAVLLMVRSRCPSFLREKDEGRCRSFRKLSNLLPSFIDELIPGGVGGERIDFQASRT